MTKIKPLSAAEKQRRFRERQESERRWFRRELVRLNVEIAKLRVPDLDIIVENVGG